MSGHYPELVDEAENMLKEYEGEWICYRFYKRRNGKYDWWNMRRRDYLGIGYREVVFTLKQRSE